MAQTPILINWQLFVLKNFRTLKDLRISSQNNILNPETND